MAYQGATGANISDPLPITRAQARDYLLGQLQLCGWQEQTGDAGIQALLSRLRCIQLDPLDRIGTNADLVAIARVPNVRKGQVYSALLPTHAFEHFAKERCLLPASAFPYYRDQAVETPWWRLHERLKRLDPELIQAVQDEVAEHGPRTAAELSDRGRVAPLDWSGWKGTSRATSMALEVLWTQCRLVVSGRSGRGKRYDLPERSLGAHAHAAPEQDFLRWGVTERVEAAGLLSTAVGPWWGMLRPARGEVVDALISEGTLCRVQVEGSRRQWLAPGDFRERRWADPDDHMRILGPLDPLLWNRWLVRHLWDFDYVWEVYKPAAKRTWGYYVCPLLHRGRLVGRVEAHVEEGQIVVDQLWREVDDFDDAALDEALHRHTLAQG